MWRTMGSPNPLHSIELGPGRGLFAADVLAWTSRKLPEFDRALKYELVETSASLRQRLQQQFAADSRVTIRESIDAAFNVAGENVIVFGNEFFDALPTEILDHRGEIR